MTFGRDFNQPIEKNVLPPNLTHLTFSYAFKRSINTDILPSTLKQLTVPKHYKHMTEIIAIQKKLKFDLLTVDD